MRIHKLKIHYLAPLLVAFLIGVYWASINNYSTNAQGGSTCAIYYLRVDNNTSGTFTTPITGLHNLALSSSTSSNIAEVVFTIDNTPLGRAVAGSNNTWSMPWYTQVAPNGGHTIAANVVLDTGTLCPAPVFTLSTYNPAISPFSASIAPALFSGQTNEALDFNLSAVLAPSPTAGTLNSVDVSVNTVFQKTAPSLGTITPLNTSKSFHYSAGTVTGTSNIGIIAYYGGASRPLSIPIKILSQTSTSGGGTTSSGSGSTSTGKTTPAAPAPAPAAPATPESNLSTLASTASIESDPATKSCTVAGLTDARYQEIANGKSRPTPAEFDAINKCFASRNFVLPTSFVPVAPDTVKTLPKSDEVVIAGAKTDTKKTSGSEVEVLKFSGKAKPNSIVLIYVHSEPLVLSTKSDSSGDWSYSLVDPLEAGKHEAYAVVDKGNGSYQRSNPFSFVIAKASASSINPKGYSLKIATVKPTATENNRPVNLYLSATGALIFFVLAGLFIILRVRSKSHTGLAKVTNAASPTPEEKIVAFPEKSESKTAVHDPPNPIEHAPAEDSTPPKPVQLPKPVEQGPITEPEPPKPVEHVAASEPVKQPEQPEPDSWRAKFKKDETPKPKPKPENYDPLHPGTLFEPRISDHGTVESVKVTTPKPTSPERAKK